LDYAFIADYARVDPSGTLTALGASYTRLETGSIPSSHLLSVAGRVKSKIDAPPVGLEVLVRGPDPMFTITVGAELQRASTSVPYGDGKLGLMFAITTVIPLVTEGLYEIEIRLDGIEARKLAFEVKLRSS